MRLKGGPAKLYRIVLVISSLLLYALPCVKAPPGSFELQEYGLLWSFTTESTVRGVAIAADGSRIVVGSGSSVYLLDNYGRVVWSFKIASGHVVAVSISGNGRWIAVGTADGPGIFPPGTVLVLDGQGNAVASEKLSGISSVSVSDRGSFAVVHYSGVGFSNCVTYFDLTYNGAEARWRRSVKFGKHVSLSSSGNYGATLVRGQRGEGCLILFDWDGNKVWHYKIEPGSLDEDPLLVSVSADGSRVAFTAGGKIRLIDGCKGLLMTFDMPITPSDSGGTLSISLSPDGRYVVYAARNLNHFSFLVLSADGGWKWVAKTPVSSVAASLDADYIAAGYGNTVLLFAKKSICAARALEEARATVLREKSRGFSVGRAEDLLSQAEAKLRGGFYDDAITLASNARSLAVDVDQDGVLNEEDFAPYVNNNLIYLGVSALLVLLVLACYAHASRRRGTEAYVFDKESGTLTTVRHWSSE